ncbi:MAG: hypothetical protein JW902_10960 [Syntrophaceae bacterium]|nr:hypothetical protein [Syntrophaceae bacterium]
MAVVKKLPQYFFSFAGMSTHNLCELYPRKFSGSEYNLYGTGDCREEPTTGESLWLSLWDFDDGIE